MVVTIEATTEITMIIMTTTIQDVTMATTAICEADEITSMVSTSLLFHNDSFAKNQTPQIVGTAMIDTTTMEIVEGTSSTTETLAEPKKEEQVRAWHHYRWKVWRHTKNNSKVPKLTVKNVHKLQSVTQVDQS